MSMSTSMPKMKNSPWYGCSKVSISSTQSSPVKRLDIYRRTGKNRFSIVIGHGCKTTPEMLRWCEEMNEEFKAKLYHVEGLRDSMTFLEKVLAERTLGLDTCNVVCRNSIVPQNETEQKIINGMITQTWMREAGESYVLTCGGLDAFDKHRKIHMGVIG